MASHRVKKYKEWSEAYTLFVRKALEIGSFAIELHSPEQMSRSRFDMYRFIRTLKEADDAPEDLKEVANRLRLFSKKNATWLKLVVEENQNDHFLKAVTHAINKPDNSLGVEDADIWADFMNSDFDEPDERPSTTDLSEQD